MNVDLLVWRRFDVAPYTAEHSRKAICAIIFQRGRSITRSTLLMIASCMFANAAVSQAQAGNPQQCANQISSNLCMAGDRTCASTRQAKVLHRAGLALNNMVLKGSSHQAGMMLSCLRMTGDGPRRIGAASNVALPSAVASGGPEKKTGIPNETLSLYKTITYVTGATLTDQIWYLTIASEAAATGGIFFVVNAATSSMMTYNYEYFWNICCRAAPGPDGIVPVSATKAIIYRGLSIIRVGALALIFGNTLPSAAIVTFAITLSRTAVYVTNDYVWNRIDVMKPIDLAPADETTVVPPMPRLSLQPASFGQK